VPLLSGVPALEYAIVSLLYSTATEQDFSVWSIRSGRFGLSRFGLGRFGHETFRSGAVFLFKPFLGVILGCQNDTLKFCNDTLNPESRNMDLLCIEVKGFEISMFSYRSYCNRRLQCYRPTQFSGAEVESENGKFGICA